MLTFAANECRVRFDSTREDNICFYSYELQSRSLLKVQQFSSFSSLIMRCSQSSIPEVRPNQSRRTDSMVQRTMTPVPFFSPPRATQVFTSQRPTVLVVDFLLVESLELLYNLEALFEAQVQAFLASRQALDLQPHRLRQLDSHLEHQVVDLVRLDATRQFAVEPVPAGSELLNFWRREEVEGEFLGEDELDFAGGEPSEGGDGLFGAGLKHLKKKLFTIPMLIYQIGSIEVVSSRALQPLSRFVQEFIRAIERYPRRHRLNTHILHKTLRVFYEYMADKNLSFQQEVLLEIPDDFLNIQKNCQIDGRLVFAAAFFIVCKDQASIDSLQLLTESFLQTVKVRRCSQPEERFRKTLLQLQFGILADIEYDLSIETAGRLLELFKNQYPHKDPELFKNIASFLNKNLMLGTNLALFYSPRVLLTAAIKASLFCLKRELPEWQEGAWWRHPVVREEEGLRLSEECIQNVKKARKR